MSSFILFNGSFLASGSAFLTADNRGFRYGDGLFETIRVKEGRILLADLHFQRLFSGALLLRFSISRLPDADHFARIILELCARNGAAVSGRVRLAIFRGDMGGEDDLPNYVIQAWPLEVIDEVDPKGLRLDVFPEGRKACDVFAPLKLNSYLLYSMAAMYARRHGWDDCLVLNSLDRAADCSIANLFYVKDGVFHTPALSEGCVAGVMRRRILDVLPSAGYRVEEGLVTLDDLRAADEVFLTNAIRGVRWVGRFGEIIYGSKLASIVGKIINENPY